MGTYVIVLRLAKRNPGHPKVFNSSYLEDLSELLAELSHKVGVVEERKNLINGVLTERLTSDRKESPAERVCNLKLMNCKTK